MKNDAAPNKDRAPRKKAKAGVAPKRVKPAAVATGLSEGAEVSAASNCRHLPGASQFPAATLSCSLSSPANFTGRVTLARLFATRGANWPADFKRTALRPGRPREMGLVSAVAWLLSSPVLSVLRMARGIATRIRNAVRGQGAWRWSCSPCGSDSRRAGSPALSSSAKRSELRPLQKNQSRKHFLDEGPRRPSESGPSGTEWYVDACFQRGR